MSHLLHLLADAYTHPHALMQFHGGSLTTLLQGQWQQAAPTPIVPASPSGGGVHPNLGGCVDSPEAPSGVLLMVGAAGLAFGSRLVRKVAAARNRASVR